MSKPTLTKPRDSTQVVIGPMAYKSVDGCLQFRVYPRRIECVSKARVYAAYMEGVQSGLREARERVRGAR